MGFSLRKQKVLEAASSAPATFANRSDYKSTWTSLSTTPEDAAVWVAGNDTDEAQLTASAAYAVSVLQRMVGINANDEILEIGCGIGRVGKALSPLCKHWTGADISPGMLAAAAQRLQGLTNVDFRELSAVGLGEFADDSFDVVYCTVVFMHLLEWDRFTYVKEALRVLRPGGRCYVDNVDIASTYGKDFFAEAASYPIDNRPAQIGMVSSGDELRAYGEWAGFDDVQVHHWDNAWVIMTGVKPGPQPPQTESTA